ncbi:glyceraldehyde-3-phosphate dehydrogenase [Nakamurella deserti]|uniref:glyceraldehyde-3-phosphate dehydrogenase n=1 Tax=Nakamurella deserti TaxID=2164074 RepID=UPI000DBE8271|nr:glyceraldehyde-3-phosphate dehydrogenase [Nakamurella deserti]
MTESLTTLLAERAQAPKEYEDTLVDAHRASWIQREELAEQMIPLIGQLYRRNDVVTSVYGRSLVNRSVIGLLKAHRFARQIDDVELPLEDTLPVLRTLAALDLGAASIDLARLSAAYRTDGAGRSLEDYLRAELAPVVGGRGRSVSHSTDVVLYGFGRIGRLLARILIEHAGGGQNLRLRAIVVRKSNVPTANDIVKRASLLRRDTIHGPFDGTITVDAENNTILANGTLIQVIYSDDPSTVDYPSYGIDDAIVIDNTGKWRKPDGLSLHLQSPGVARVLLTSPGGGGLKNVVHGINHTDITPDDTMITAASCTTNAITPVLKVVNDRWGIVHGHVETVHSFTNDQNLVDNFHAGDRRGRSAALNMVIAETGAAKAVAKALPELAGKLTGSAIRVPTADVSMAILNLTLERPTTKSEVNSHLRSVSLDSDLHQQIDYIESPEVVSSDFVGSRHAGVVDGLATISNGTDLVLYVWYDNEFGYSCQVIRVLEEMAAVNPPKFPRLLVGTG